MRIVVLGAAAGGGLPQWNCACRLCQSARAQTGVRPRTQSSLAITDDGEHWALVNASPDIGAQIRQTRELWPRETARRRHSPIGQVFLTNADVDHIAGLLTLREGQPFDLLATRPVLEALAANAIFNVLAPERVTRTALRPGSPVDLVGGAGTTVTAFTVPSKVALFLETPDALDRLGSRSEDTIALEFRRRESGQRVLVIPGCAQIDQPLKDWIDGADVVFFDGTLFDDNEMITAGLSQKTGRRMGHVPISGPGGTLQELAELHIGRRIFIHINNSNPILCPSDPATERVCSAGWEIAHDGLEVVI